MSRLAVKVALGVEAVGLALLIACSFFNTPFANDRLGPAGRIQWGPDASVPPDLVPCSCYFVEVAGADAYDFEFSGPVRPAEPGPSRGQTIDVSYLETVRGWVILSVTTDPGQPDRVTYATPDYDRYRDGIGLAYAAFAGLFIGAVLVLAGALLLRRAVPGTRAGTLSTSLGLASGLGLAPVAGFAAGLPGSALTYQLLSLAWICAATAAVGLGVLSRSRREQPAAFARFGLFSSIAVTIVTVVAWLAIGVRILSAVS